MPVWPGRRLNEPSAHSRPWRYATQRSRSAGAGRASRPAWRVDRPARRRAARRSPRIGRARLVDRRSSTRSRPRRARVPTSRRLRPPDREAIEQLDERAAVGLRLHAATRTCGLEVRRAGTGRAKPSRSCRAASRRAARRRRGGASDMKQPYDCPPLASAIPKCAFALEKPAMKWPSASEIGRFTCKSYLSPAAETHFRGVITDLIRHDKSRRGVVFVQPDQEARRVGEVAPPADPGERERLDDDRCRRLTRAAARRRSRAWSCGVLCGVGGLDVA